MRNFCLSLLMFVLSSHSVFAQTDHIVCTSSPSSSLTCPDGSINTDLSGGFAPYTFQWQGPDGFTSTAEDLTGLLPGKYKLHATDGLCGELNLIVGVTYDNEAGITVVSKKNPTSCSKDEVTCDGALDISIAFSNPPFTIDWSGPDGYTSNDEDIADLCPGEYTVKVKNQIGCQIEKTIKLCCCSIDNGEKSSNKSGPELDFCEEKPTFNIDPEVYSPYDGQETGSIHLHPSGFINSGLAYQWTYEGQPFEGNAFIDNLEIGTYCVTVTNGCETKKRCFKITYCSIADLAVNIEWAIPACEGHPIGGIHVADIVGGNAPYSTEWSNGVINTYYIGGLGIGEAYCVTVTDATYCTATDCQEVHEVELTVYVNENCTRITECGSTDVLVEEFDWVETYSDPLCSYIDHSCQPAPWLNYSEYVGYAYYLHQGDPSCNLFGVCHNNDMVFLESGTLIDESWYVLDYWSHYKKTKCYNCKHCYYQNPEVGIWESDGCDDPDWIKTIVLSAPNDYCSDQCYFYSGCDLSQTGECHDCPGNGLIDNTDRATEESDESMTSIETGSIHIKKTELGYAFFNQNHNLIKDFMLSNISGKVVFKVSNAFKQSIDVPLVFEENQTYVIYILTERGVVNSAVMRMTN
jgi:SprB repeat